jgi:amino acid permease
MIITALIQLIMMILITVILGYTNLDKLYWQIQFFEDLNVVLLIINLILACYLLAKSYHEENEENT